MKPVHKALLLGIVQLALVASLGGKLLADRATRPRFWLKTAPVDPDLPIRGRYVRLRVEVPAPGLGARFETEQEQRMSVPPPAPPLLRNRGPERFLLEARPQGLTAVSEEGVGREGIWGSVAGDGKNPIVILQEPLAYFIPEHVPDPSRRATGEELWVEATLPKKGPLRPIRLGVKKGGVLTPLPL
ncbi:MAG TPA: hypothetical protein VN883_15260 [Myxococcales bacterium]|nr:hypothetical protein [Myxococcales bacterium]